MYMVQLQAEKKLVGQGNKEYLPIQGLAAFNKATAELLLGPDNAAIKEVTLSPSGRKILQEVHRLPTLEILCHIKADSMFGSEQWEASCLCRSLRLCLIIAGPHHYTGPKSHDQVQLLQWM